MSSQQLSRSSSRSEQQNVEMTDKSEIQNENLPQNRHENSTAEMKSKHKQNADSKENGANCKGHRKRHGPGFMHHQPHFYGPMMFGPMRGQYHLRQTEDHGDETTEEYEQFFDNDYEQSGHEGNDESAVGGKYAGPRLWHRFQGMGPMGEHGPNMMRGKRWWRRMMGEQNTMPQGMFSPMPGVINFPRFRGPMEMRRGRRHSPHHNHNEVETKAESNDESCSNMQTEGAMNTTDSSSSSDEDIETISPECCEKEAQGKENTDDSKRRRRGPRGGPMGSCRRRVMRQCFAMGMLHPFMMKPWLAGEDTSESKEQCDEQSDKSNNECKKRGKHFRRAMKYRLRMGMFHPFMLKPWMLKDSSSEEDSDIPTEGDSEPKKTKKWQKQRKCRRHAMRECMAMGMLPPGAAKPWMFRESSDSEDTSDSSTEGSETECKGKKRCCRKARKGPRKMWRRMLRKQIRINALAGQMGSMRCPMGQRRFMMAGMGRRYEMGPGNVHCPMSVMHRMGLMRGPMGPRHGFGPMAGMHRMRPMRGPMGPRHGFGPMADMQRRCPMRGMGPRQCYGPMNAMGPGPLMNPWMPPFGIMRPRKFMKKFHKENRKAEKESIQKDINSLSKDFEEGMTVTENKEQNKV